MGIEADLKKNGRIVDAELKKFLPGKVNEKWMRERLGLRGCDVNAVNLVLVKPARDILGRGGKRLRSLLMFLSCSAVGGSPGKIRKFSVIPELIHNGSLIADDIEDNSLKRRGLPALHLIYGQDVAINLSSTLYYLPLQVIKKSSLRGGIKLKLYETFNSELLKLHVGQGTDIFWHRTAIPVDEKQYFAMCANKTGTLLRFSAKLGAILGGGKPLQVNGLGKFAESIGVAFQIRDDVLNLTGKLGKKRGEDVTEGKMSLPVIRTLSVAGSRDKKTLLAILRKHTSDKGQIARAIEIMRKSGSLDYSGKAADEIVRKSWSRLRPLIADSDAKKKLGRLGRFAAERDA